MQVNAARHRRELDQNLRGTVTKSHICCTSTWMHHLRGNYHMLSMYLYGITKGACLHTARRGLNYRRGGRSKGSGGKWGAQLRPHLINMNALHVHVLSCHL